MLTKLAIVMTNKCSASCDMCCFSCSPRGEMLLDTDLMKDVIRQASEVKGIRAVGFTGGEPFLFFEQLKECCVYAKSLGLRLTVNTNGFWGNNEERALKMIGELKEAGVELLSFSADRYHQQYVPIEDLKTAMHITHQVGLKHNISIMETADSDDIVKMTEALRPEIYQTEISNHPLLPVGKALDNISNGNYVRYFETKNAKCIFGGMIQLNFDGNYYLCCSQFSRDIPKINLGNAREVKLADLERNIVSDDYLYIMLRNGLIWYIDLAKELGFKIPDYVCSSCHICYYVFRNHELLETIKDRVKEEAGRLRVQHLLNLNKNAK